jgi:ABC-2 type transport system ATP-binding protein
VAPDGAGRGELLELVNIADAAGRKLRGFPGGMRRGVGIAQALLNDPELLIVPEPASGLDPRSASASAPAVPARQRRTVLLSTHIVDDVAQTCTELAVLRRGRRIRRLGAQPAATTHEAKRDRPPRGARLAHKG